MKLDELLQKTEDRFRRIGEHAIQVFCTKTLPDPRYWCSAGSGPSIWLRPTHVQD